MKKKIITISREFGSGGRTIAKMVAEKLGFAYYDKELVKQVANETGFNENYVEQQGEYAPSKSAFAYAFATQGVDGIMGGMTPNDFLWVMQRKIILDLAEKESCVIVGRCADFILKERDDCFDVFIHAPIEARAERVIKLYGETEKKIEKRLEDKDKKRKVFYKHYTNQEWGNAQNYDLTLNSETFGLEGCADIIAGLVKDI